MKKVYITALSKFLPNKPISNDEMEDYLGYINNTASKSKKLILRSNKIHTRYYALDKKGNSTHSNAQMTAKAIEGLSSAQFKLEDMELLAGGTTSPDQMIPSHISMVQGELGLKPIEILSTAGSCNAGMQALKYAYLSVGSGNTSNAVCTGSEKLSTWMHARNFKKESDRLSELEKNPIIGFEKDFLRWMLSDGAAAALLQDKPNKDGISLRIDWIDFRSYSNELKTCMYAGTEKLENGDTLPWRDISADDQAAKSIFSLKQDVKILGDNIVEKGNEFMLEIMDKRGFGPQDFDYFLPHLSSEYFRSRINQKLIDSKREIPQKKWFTNLVEVGNVGAASIYLMLEELMNSGKLKKGEKLFLMVPESARFSYAFSMLTVV